MQKYLIYLFLFSSLGYSQVVKQFRLSIENSPTSTTSQSLSVQCTGSNRLLLLQYATRNLGWEISSATYAGVNLIKAAEINSATTPFPRAEVWYLVAPATGTNTLTVNIASSGQIVFNAYCFSGVYQASPIGTVVTNSGLGTTATVAVSSMTDGAVLWHLSSPISNLTVPGSGSFDDHWARYAASTYGSTYTSAGGNGYEGAATVNVSSTLTSSLGGSNPWVIIGVPITPDTYTPPVEVNNFFIAKVKNAFFNLFSSPFAFSAS